MTSPQTSLVPGHLELILGPMWAGKSSRLVDLWRQHDLTGVPTLVINHSSDAERGHDAKRMCTHDGVEIPCKSVERLHDVPSEDLHKAEVILINEAQFFPDGYDWIVHAVEELGKQVHAAGLDGDFLRRPFGTWLGLIPLADRVRKLRATCRHCAGKPAPFSRRIAGSRDAQHVVGAADMYEPVCRSCYLSLACADKTA